ncbi:MAG TPA: C4-type zinc ribbon domain-containing protein [Marmoricola sp.]|nr:C4-type zinc ribbon domain-containing protein [Marmoricola sp.]
MDLPGLTAEEHPLKADPFAQLKLLDVQELDTQLDGLAHQLATIPEAAALAELGARRAELDGAVRDLRVEVDDLTAEQKRADADVEQVKARRARDQGMIDAGSVADPKALQRMLGELESLERRISDLEDVEIEVMERLETAQANLEQHTEDLAKLDRDLEALEHTRAHKARELEEKMAAVGAERKTTASGIPADLLGLYQKLRDQKGGVGAAALRRRECSGCRLTLNPSDLATIAAAPADDVLRCEECSRILVRTGESGL